MNCSSFKKTGSGSIFMFLPLTASNVFIFWLMFCIIANNMDIFPQLFISLVRHNISNIRIPALSFLLKFVIWRFYFTHQFMHAKELLYLLGKSGNYLILHFYIVQIGRLFMKIDKGLAKLLPTNLCVFVVVLLLSNNIWGQVAYFRPFIYMVLL